MQCNYIVERLRRVRSVTAATLLAAQALGGASAEAKDLFVALNGNDTVTYDANSISNPWGSIVHGLYNLKAGDTLNIRGGVYTLNYPALLRNDYSSKNGGGDPSETMLAESGTQSAPIVVQNYGEEEVTIDQSKINAPFVDLDNKSYWTFRGLRLVNGIVAFQVGKNNSSFHNTFENLYIQANRGGDNMGGIVLWGALADYTIIKNCTIVGPGGTGVHQNTNGIYLKAVNHVKILNNEISNAPIGIYYKHANSATSADQAEIEIAFNYIYDTPRNAINSNSNFGYYHDNVMGANTGTSYFANANGVMGGNHNTLNHNTFFGGAFWVVDAVAPSFNTLTNNIFRAELQLSKNKGTDHGSTLSFNVYQNLNAILSHDGIDVIDPNSKIGAPIFAGGGGAPAKLDGYRLAATSVGFKVSSTPDVDIGARIDLVGPAASGATVHKAPSPPEGLSIQ